MLSSAKIGRKSASSMMAWKVLIVVVLMGVMIIPSVSSEISILGMEGTGKSDLALTSNGVRSDTREKPLPGIDAVTSWSTSGNSLPTAVEGARLVSYNGYIIQTGGYAGSSAFTDVRKAQVQSDGNIGAWSSTTSLPAGRTYHGSVAYNGYIYVIGGGSGGSPDATTVYFATIDASGNVGTWNTAANALSQTWGLGELAVCNGYLYVIGGLLGGTASSSVYYSQIGGGGVPGTWTSTTSLPAAKSRLNFDNLVYNSRIYVIGGYDGSADSATVYYASCGSGPITIWSTATNGLPETRSRLAAVIDTDLGQLYALGGYTTALTATTKYATINPSTGNIDAAWTNGPDLPGARRYPAAIYVSSRVAILITGGQDGSSVYQTTVYYGKTQTNSPPNTPALSTPWDFQKGGEWASALRPQFTFSTTDPDGDALQYNIQVDDDPTFGSLNIDATSTNPTGWSGTPPYASGVYVTYTDQIDLASGTTYYWKVKAIDPAGSNTWSLFSSSWSVTIQSGQTQQSWFQTTQAQFNKDTLDSYAQTTAATGGVGGAGAVESKVQYLNLTPIADAFIDQFYNDHAYGDCSFFNTGNGGVASFTTRGLLRFDLTTLPSDAVIQSTKLYAYKYSGTTTSARNLGMHRVNYTPINYALQWGEGSVCGETQISSATWDSARHNILPWGTAGGDFASSATATVTVNALGWYGWELKNDITTFGIYSWLLKDDSGEPSSYNSLFYTKEYSTVSFRPALNITYFRTGSVTSTTVNYADGPTARNSWDAAAWSKNITYGSVTVAVQKYTTSWVWTGIQSSSSPISISSLGMQAQIRLVANQTYLGGSPKLLDWEVSWMYPVPTPPSVALTSPNGGENWEQGSSHTITWNIATPGDFPMKANPITLYYSTTGSGGSWTQIATNLPNTGSYTPWIIPYLSTTNAYIKVEAADNQIPPNVGMDLSNGAFTMYVNLPQVTLTSPNGGENWTQGSTQTITWNFATQGTWPLKVNPITLYYSTAGASGPWTQIDSNLANTGSYSWIVPSASTTTACVRIDASDNQVPANIGYDVCNAVFTISAGTSPTVSVTSPNGGEKWFIQAAYDITFTVTSGSFPLNATPITISYSTAGPSGPWIPIATNLPNTSPYNWSIPASVPPSTNAYIKVEAKDNQATPLIGNDTSNATFTFAVASKPAVTVTSPNGGEIWAIGETKPITWTASQGTFPLAANPITIYYSTAGTSGPWTQLFTNVLNNGTYNWKVSGPVSANSYVKIDAKDDRSTPNISNDTSNNAFTISQPSIPNVVNTIPVDGATNVSLNTTIIITFSEAMNKTATEGAISAVPSISGAFAWNGANKTVTWTPSANLTPSTQYSITISTNAKSQAGMNLASPVSFSFTTMPPIDIYPPYVVSTIPPEGATNISNSTKIDIKWNESMNQTSAENAFSPSPAITCAWSWSGTNQTCIPGSYLQANTQYTITIAKTAKDLAGNAMKNVFTLNFTTAVGVVPTPPSVTGTNPMNNSVNVPMNTNIAITFSEGMSKTITQGAISSSPSITGTFTWDGPAETVTWNPSTDLQPSAKYTVTVSTAAKSIAGINMKSAYLFSFTASQFSDVYPPFIVSTNPSNGTASISLDTTIDIQWNETMDYASAESAFSSTPAITCTWSWSGALQTCTPTAALQPETQYTVTIDSTAKDSAGNSMAKPYTFSFTTGTPPDTTPPFIVKTNPSNGSKDIATASKITITFNEPMDQGATGGAVSITPGSIIKKEWDINGTSLTLTASLENGQRYTITISTNAKDLAGNTMTSEYRFVFTTKGGEGSGPTTGIDLVSLLLILIIAIICVFLVVILIKRKRTREKQSSLLAGEPLESTSEGGEAISESEPKPVTASEESSIEEESAQPQEEEHLEDLTKEIAPSSGVECPLCGKDVPTGNKWCLNCGEEIGLKK